MTGVPLALTGLIGSGLLDTGAGSGDGLAGGGGEVEIWGIGLGESPQTGISQRSLSPDKSEMKEYLMYPKPHFLELIPNSH